MGFNRLIIVSLLVAFVLTLLLGVVYIDFLKKDILIINVGSQMNTQMEMVHLWEYIHLLCI